MTRDSLPPVDGLSDAEVLFAKTLTRDMLRVFKRHGVEQTPLIHLRLEDMLATYLLVRRLEAALFRSDLFDSSNDFPDRTTAAGRRSALHPLIEAVGKTRERLRKAVKEFEEVLAAAGTPINQGFADKMKPIIKKAQGVLEAALTPPDTPQP
jgi:hypothetical protein